MTPPLLEIRNLRLELHTERGVLRVLNGVSLTVPRGSVLGLVGETGCGKTLTARCLLRLLPRTASIVDGEIRFDGEDLLRMPDEDLRRLRGNRIAMIFQDPAAALNPVRTIGAQIAEAIRTHEPSADREAARVKAIASLQAVEMPAPERVLRSYPHQLSGGMQQRAMIAMAIVCGPGLLIADEPTTALDVTVQAQILDLMRRLARDIGAGLIFITHDFGVVAELCNDVAVMYGGRIVETASAETLFDAPAHPYTRGLFAALPQNARPGEDLGTIPGSVPTLAGLDPSGCLFRNRCPQRLPVCDRVTPSPSVLATGHAVACHLHPGAPA
ncbi:MAG: ABC transporter ATP-binding protein [Rhodospirillaceae bacterium]|nr:ABC transporter ATP-binding protein [Rhodospirillaceae bacterium]